MLESIVKCVQSHGKVLHTRKPRSRQRPMSNLVCLKKARKYRANCSLKALTERRVSAQRLKKHVFYELIVASRALPGRSALHSGAESNKIKFTQPVKNSLKTAISIYDFAFSWPRRPMALFVSSDGADLQEQRFKVSLERPGFRPGDAYPN